MDNEALYFRHNDEELFAVLYPAIGSDEGFIICHPAPQDMMRAHYSQTLLSKKIQSLGFPVLRFDYSGTGDSTGEIKSLNLWKEEIIAAVAELKRRTGVKRVSVIGTRLGATLAILASQELGFKRLILWDPIVNGPELLKAYQDCHQRLLNRVPDESPYPRNQKNCEQSCGYAWPRSIQNEISKIHPEALHSFAKKIQFVLSEDSDDLKRLLEIYRGEDKEISIQRPGEELFWAHDRYLNLRLFAPNSLRIISQLAEDER